MLPVAGEVAIKLRAASFLLPRDIMIKAFSCDRVVAAAIVLQYDWRL